MREFGLLFRSILTSSIIEEDVVTRWVWCCFIIEMDRSGIVHGTIPALARRWNVSRDDLEKALDRLQSPDPDSGCEEEEGRRIVNVGMNDWQVVSYEYYQSLADLEYRRAQTRERVRKHRESKARNAKALQGVTRNAPSTSLSNSSSIENTEGANSPDDESARARARARGTKARPADPDEVQEYLDELGEKRFTGEVFFDANEAKGWKVGKTQTPMKDWRAVVRTWRRFRDEDERRDGESKRKRIARGQRDPDFRGKF